MTRYFFDLNECGNATGDDEGVELPDLAAVRSYAIAAARDVMSAEVKEGRLCLSCKVEVRTATGPFLTVPFREAIALTG